MLRNSRYLFCTMALLLSAILIAPGYAAKGGNGGGKPGGGGEEPPVVELPPVRYEITKVTLPFGINPLGTNEAGAIVGIGNSHAFAYLPWLGAYDLNDPALGVTGVTPGWHMRTAFEINNQGDIVGRLEPDDPEDDRLRPFYLNTVTMELTVLGPFDLDAVKESATCINDSGDIVILSDGTLYVGNPGLYGNAPIAFEKVDITALIDFVPSAGATLEIIQSSGELSLSNRLAGGMPAIIAGNIDDGADPVFLGRKKLGFRMTTDQSFFESSLYEDGSGNRYDLNVQSINDLGDVAGWGRVSYAKKNKGQSYSDFSAIWKLGEAQIDTIIPGNPTKPFINNDGDATVGDSTLWHNTWSATNGELDIPSLIHPDDANRNLYDRAFELTDGIPIAAPNSVDPLDFWPVIFARGQESVDGASEYSFLILDPVAFP